MALSKREYRRLQRAVTRAFSNVLESIKHEPSTIIITGEPNKESDTTINDITEWLFRRRQDNGNAAH